MIMMYAVISTIVVALALLAQNRINTKKIHRARQVLFPFVAALYAIVAVVVIYSQFLEISRFIHMLFNEWLSKWLGEWLGAWLPKPDFFTNYALVILNLLIMAAFIALKTALCPILSALCNKKKFLQATVSSFYAYDEQYEEWFLQHKWVGFRKFAFAVLCGLTLGTGCLLGITWSRGTASPLWDLVFPCAALLIVAEIYNFINGQTKEEFEHTVLGEDADARRISNFYKVREALEQILPHPLLTSHTGFEFVGRQTPMDLIKVLRESPSKIDNITADYFSADDRCKTSDVDCVQATVHLMHRENVVVFNPFYKDFSTYITLPLVNALLAGKKAVVVSGRTSNCEDIRTWLSELLAKYTHMHSLWNVQRLSEHDPDCDIGILSFPQLYDKRVIAVNKPFFNETDFVLLIEPSLIVNTGQVALSIIAQEMHCHDEKPVYCVCDRNTDGLVDTLSHVLHAEFTNVVAPPVPRCIYTGMMWDADGDFLKQQLFNKQTRYLGNGVELAAIAVKNQIPRVSWYSETKAPIKDIQWIAGQYHPSICRYMNQPAQQKSLYEKIRFIPNLWSSSREKEEFIIAEDEFCNMFSTMRAYLSRGVTQSFVNVLSENYLLRDYMRCNKQMFLSNPHAIPSIVPDYAKTERNTLIKLILTMTYRPVTEAEILSEFRLVGIETDDAFEILSRLLEKYELADSSIFTIQSVRSEVDELTTVSTHQYSIPAMEFDEHFADSLKSAYFILEDEKHESDYIDAKLFGHVTQMILPGQFVTYDGKYYVARHVSPQSGVVLRRASDLYDGRKYYRQIREYDFDCPEQDEILALRTVTGVETAFIRMSFCVNTTGYLELADNHDLANAKVVDLSDDPSVGKYQRRYCRKTVMRIRLPDADESVCYTICMLLSEVFRSVFPDGYPYLAVTTKTPADIDGTLRHIVYSVTGHAEDGCIYIIEDSELDLGLLEAVERYFPKLMEIVTDYLAWHFEKMSETEPVGTAPTPITIEPQPKKKKKKGFLGRIAQGIARIFGGKKKDDAPEEEMPVGESAQEAPGEGITIEKETDNPPADVVPAFDEEALRAGNGALTIESEDGDEQPVTESEDEPAPSPEKTRYQRECFLLFGAEDMDPRLHLEDTLSYLQSAGWAEHSLTKARNRDAVVMSDLDLTVVNHCDFCSVPLNGVSYDVLNDGRVRCNDCSTSAISTIDDFKDLFYQSLEMMEAFYGVKFHVPIRVEMADARKVAAGAGTVFKPSTEFAGRVLGFAQRKGGKYSLLIENGSPRLASIDTMVHELTHLWQYLNWNDKQVVKIYRMGRRECTAIARDIVYEGMAMWASVQYLYQIGETYYAAQQEALAEARTDVYGIGFRLYREQYPLVKDSSLIRYSPFTAFPTIDPEQVKAAIQAVCENEHCSC